MKAITTLGALCLCIGLLGCQSTQDSTTNAAVSPAAVSEDCCGSCQETCPATGASMGAVSDCSSKSECSSKTECSSSGDASFGAVSENSCSSKSDCSSKSSCTKSQDTSFGAVSETNCSSQKSSCTK